MFVSLASSIYTYINNFLLDRCNHIWKYFLYYNSYVCRKQNIFVMSYFNYFYFINTLSILYKLILYIHTHLSSFQRCLLLKKLASSLHLHLHVSYHFIYLVSLVLDIRLKTLTFNFLATSGTHNFA